MQVVDGAVVRLPLPAPAPAASSNDTLGCALPVNRALPQSELLRLALFSPRKECGVSVAECESCRDRLFGGSKLLEFKPEKQLLLVAIAVTLHPPEIEQTAWRSLLWMGIELSCERPSYLFELLEELIVVHGTFRVDYAALCLHDRVGLPLSVLLSDLERPWLGQDFLLRQQDPCATAVLALWEAWTARDRHHRPR